MTIVLNLITGILLFLAGIGVVLLYLKFFGGNPKKPNLKESVNGEKGQSSGEPKTTSLGKIRSSVFSKNASDFNNTTEFFDYVFSNSNKILQINRYYYLEKDENNSFAVKLLWNKATNNIFSDDVVSSFLKEFIKNAGVSQQSLDGFILISNRDENISTSSLEFLKNNKIKEIMIISVGNKLFNNQLLLFFLDEDSENSFSKYDDKKEQVIISDIKYLIGLEFGKFDDSGISLDSPVTPNETKYRMIFENLHDTYFRTNASGIITMVSPSCFKAFGYTQDELIGANFTKKLFSDQNQRHEFLKILGLNGSVIEFESQMVDKTGKSIWVSTNANYINYDNEKDDSLSGFEGIVRDISGRKGLEDQLIKAERMAAVGTLAGGVAHEFNNINLAILGYSELGLLKKDLNDDVLNYFRTIKRSALRAKNITSNLLTFSRGKKSGGIKAGNLVRVVEETLMMLEHEVSSTGVIIEKDLTAVPATMMDTTQIGQVIMNILINAHHSLIGRENKKIKLKTGFDDNFVSLSIEDNGCGIPDNEITQIFSPFFSTKGEHSTRKDDQSKIKGTGLGLAISHTIIENHKGLIEVESNLDVGTKFTIKLPLVSIPKPKKIVPSIKKLKLESISILILDDEPDLRYLLETFFVSLGHKVFKTGDGKEALEILNKEKCDIVLVDLQMPQMTGIDFISHFAKLDLDVRPMAIIMTGKVSTKEFEEQNSEYIYGMIKKPFKLNEMKELIFEAIENRQKEQITN